MTKHATDSPDRPVLTNEDSKLLAELLRRLFEAEPGEPLVLGSSDNLAVDGRFNFERVAKRLLADPLMRQLFKGG